MLKIIFLLGLALSFCYCECNIYSYDPIGCVQLTTEDNCIYNEFLNQCQETRNQNLGCSNFLNSNACINQLTFGGDVETKCIFQNRCREANKFHLEKLGCHKLYSKYACLNVSNKDCFWNGKCEDSSKIILSPDSEELIYPFSVTPQLCAKYQKHPCMNNGIKRDYLCVTIYEIQFKELKCSTLGLNEIGCRSILTEQEMCLFDNYQCKYIKPYEIISCSLTLNKLACLSISKPNLMCEWQKQECRTYVINENKQCQDIFNVNIYVCANQDSLCMFDVNNFRCTEVTLKQLEDLDCNTPGITRLTCLSIKNKQCTFYKGFCQTLQDKELSEYHCSMQLNQAACINITTIGQFCLWDGKGCQNVEINQDLDCHMFDKFQVNGNVCQAIIKPNQMCKYNEITKICIQSSSNDYCITPYLNLFGCVGIFREGQTCKWIDSSCQEILIIPFETTCSSLKYANYQACSQVFESIQLGCYFDEIASQCVTLQINNNNNLEDKKRVDEFLKSVTCANKSLGLNKTICGAITTENSFCRWQYQRCNLVDKDDIAKLPCIDLNFANQNICALVKYNNEFCRYFEEEKGCINQLEGDMFCDDPGLNAVNCKQAQENCYFENNKCKSLGDIKFYISLADLIVLQKLQCLANSPTKLVCLEILTKGQLCQWSNKNQQCYEVVVIPNKRCADYSSFQVNANVCASIIMDKPNNIIEGKEQSFEEQNPGYCEYDRLFKICQVKKSVCNDKCCTSNEELGINAHSCSRFSSQEPGVYCYFKDLRCQELTNLDVDISNPESVKIYYNINQFTCSQMNKNSCHMIEWSTTQTCYYNGFACVNLNMKDQTNFIEFTKPSSILNKNACLAIEANNSINYALKYFEYDSERKNCKLLIQPYPKYTSCESVKGNSNICLGLTQDLYCKWDRFNLKCVTITKDQQQEIINCNSYQNKRSCIENPYSACQFSLALDKCIDAPLDQECSYYNTTGQISQKTCSLITKQGQICEFQNNYCVSSNKIVDGCNLDGINKRGCYKNTKGLCRWDDVSGSCYENRTALEELECTSNLNQILCMKVTKQPCMWNYSQLQCVYFNQMTNDQYQEQNSNNQYNEWACTLIIGAGYTFDAQHHKCKLLENTQNYGCQDIQMNNYACQFLTKGNKCYFDNNEIPPKKKCKIFDMDQSVCTTNIAINIDVCMDIPKTCKFSLENLSCQKLSIKQNDTCLDLQDLQSRGEYVNKLGCSSISEFLNQNDGEYQCYQDKEFLQQCNYQKFCFWNNYTCKVSKQLTYYFDREHYTSTQISNWVFQINNCTDSIQCNQFVTKKEFLEDNVLFPGLRNDSVCGLGRCDYTNEPCSQHIDCEPINIENLLINDDGSIKPPIIQNQTCQQYCQMSNDEYSCKNSDVAPQEILEPEIQQEQQCSGRCNVTKSLCKTFINCPHFQYQINQTVIEDNKTIIKEVDVEGTQFCSEYSCSQQEAKLCNSSTECLPFVQKSWKIKDALCQKQNVYSKSSLCKIFYFLKLKCEKILSKGLCLQMTNQNCFFDLKQGGCIQLEGNEHKVPSCDCILDTRKPTIQCDQFQNICKFSGQPLNEYRNTCQIVSSKSIKCKSGNQQNVADTNCHSINHQYKTCVEQQIYQTSYSCLNVPNPSIFNCAAAVDFCRYSNERCISDQLTYPCEKFDKSFSKSWCEFCKYNYDLLGFCQREQNPPPLLADKSNQYYLCYEVTLLTADKENKKIACGMVKQACRYSIQCEDATHFTCDKLLNFIVSEKACVRCQGMAVQYNTEKQFCNITEDQIFSCNLLNQQACLQKTQKIMCKWEDYECKMIERIIGSDKRECSIYNRDACIQFQYDCWFDLNIKQCIKFDPKLGSCDLLLNKDLCMYSLKESCLWDQNNEICNKNDQEITGCQGLNKFGCLNQSILLCVWSDIYGCQLADFNNNSQSCDSPIGNSQKSYITHFSKKVCSSININLNCFQDNYYRCRQTIITDIIKCDSNGLNKFGCINRSYGKCQYLDEQKACIEIQNDQIGCIDSLNKEACISQKQTCKFENNTCSLHQVNKITDIINQIENFPYSNSVCSYLDKQIQQSFLYSQVQNRCIDVSNRNPFIDNCSMVGINRYACQQKTILACEYDSDENICLKTEQSILKTINTCFSDKYLNWVSCISLSSECKFIQNKCLPIESKDNCQYLQDQQIIVKSSICATRKDKGCKLNITSNTCEILNKGDNFQCTTSGLNKIGCLFQTKGYLCKFQQDQCVFDFQESVCEDLINEDKCYSIKTKGQYCRFDQNKGCYQIDNSKNELLKCQHSFKTNPITCSISIDVPCYYDKQKKICIEFLASNLNQETLTNNQNWDNKISFNALTCQRYNINNQQVFWKFQDDQKKLVNECYEISDTDLAILKCTNFLNKLACINLQTPFQYCKYENFVCNSYSIQTIKQQPYCLNYKLVNTGAFCELTTDVPCEYSVTDKECKQIIVNTQIKNYQIFCEYNHTYKRGYNYQACQLDKNNCTFSGACYRNIDQSVAFCKDVSAEKIGLCKEIITQGCSQIQNRCLALQESDYQSITCSQAQNAIGCVLIQTYGQTCYYDQYKKECKFQDLQKDFKWNCSDLNEINSYLFCEQTIDKPCKYNLDMKKCDIANGNNYDCIRGLNKLACFSLTEKSQKCKFLKYCYGPNDRLLECNSDLVSDCCQQAKNKEVCLFQKKFQCQWNMQCYAYEKIEEIECNKIHNASVNVCSSIKNQFCIFDSENFVCKQIIPQSCDEVQTSYHCNQINDFPCVWDEMYEACIYKEKNSLDGCKKIQEKFGNLKACTMIEGLGQKCIFENNQCQTFYQKEGFNNCTSNINIFSCLQQTVSQCEWVIKTIQVKKSQQNNYFENQEIGECKEFTQFDTSNCDIFLSFKSCLSVRKIGAFCIWKNNQCKRFYISDQISNQNKTPQLAQNVNPIVCGLYYDERLISYSQESYSCIEVLDVKLLSCATSKFGLNSLACLNIQNELCKWDNIQKTCELVRKENTNLKISCNLSGLSSRACTLIEIDESCGFIGNGCGKVDSNVNCKHQGLNKFGCLKITNYPCAWIKNEEDEYYHCDDFQPYDSCNEIKLQVNSMVCALVQVDACIYNQETFSCQIPQNTLFNCETEGLNYIGCSQIKGCYYENNKCQPIQQSSYSCLQFPLANEDICKNAQDSCKYSPLNYGCIISKSNEICKEPGLSQQGCIQQKNDCYWNNNNCQCLSFLNVFPDCKNIISSEKCEQFIQCQYNYEITHNFKANQLIKSQNQGRCERKFCKDFKVHSCNNKQLQNDFCYLDQQKKCQQANTCNDIRNSETNCSNLIVNGIPCVENPNQSTCRALICSEFDEKMCDQFNVYCIYNDTCQSKLCEDLYNQQACRYNKCEWDKWNQKCKNNLPCEKYLTKFECHQNSYNNIQCTWVSNSEKSFCTSKGCRYLKKGLECENAIMIRNVCVRLHNQQCVQCEEIQDICLCLNQNFCSYNQIQMRCESINCNQQNYNCQDFKFCQFNENKKTCYFKCDNHKNQIDCNGDSVNCEWDVKKQSCLELVIQTQPPLDPPIITTIAYHIYLCFIIWLHL
ncbi:unnamed protein product [Paramecium sonneborni]|uniref:Transmembrane protein n=1 Tax=Paramecium sonneborni TaxID=65129 RepID=A0A8S1LKY5_9CILI|nr:unnamed protein product [Paramecium sonneborni]